METKYLCERIVISEDRYNWSKLLTSLFILVNGMFIYLLDKGNYNILLIAGLYVGVLLNALITKSVFRKHLYALLGLIIYLSIIILFPVNPRMWAILGLNLPILFVFLIREYYAPMIVGLPLLFIFYNYYPLFFGVMYGMLSITFISTILAIIIRKYLEDQDKYTQMKIKDHLTGLYNSEYTLQLGCQMLKNRASAMVIVLDIDNFKEINDTYGHLSGNKILVELSGQLNKKLDSFRSVIGRLGGDEFIVILEDYTQVQSEEIYTSLDEHLNSFKFTVDPMLERVKLAISSGTSYHISKSETEIDELVSQAKQKKYYKKYEKEKIGELEEKTIQSLDQNIQQYIQVLKEKDMYTYVHSVKTALFARNIAQDLDVDPQFIDDIYIGGLLHDIGKILVSNSILRKPRKLTGDEYKIIQGHVLSSLNILDYEQLADVTRNAIRYHHERWDGKGYPGGKIGKEVPLEGRILAVADAYTAMTIKRVYRKALSHDEAMLEIGRNSGTQFDPYIVDIVLKEWTLQKQA